MMEEDISAEGDMSTYTTTRVASGLYPNLQDEVNGVRLLTGVALLNIYSTYNRDKPPSSLIKVVALRYYAWRTSRSLISR